MTLAELMAAATAHRAAAAAQAQPVIPAVAAQPVVPGETLVLATAPLTVQEDGRVLIDEKLVKDGTATFKVVDGALEGVNVGAPAVAEPAEGVLELATKVGELTVAKAGVEAENTELVGAVASMVPIISASLDKMEIALGGSKVDVSKLEPAQLVALHETTAGRFASKFPTGAVAAVADVHDKGTQITAEKQAELDVFTRRAKLTAGSR
jgi:hypothetical protein